MESNFDKTIIDKYKEISKEKEAEYWKSAIFVFDASALIDFYFIPVESRGKIYSEIFGKLKERLWIPFHVQYEYLKNREKTIKKPIGSYLTLKKNVEEIGKMVQEKMDKQIQNIVENSQKKDRHPHIEQEGIEQFKEDVSDFIEKFKVFEEDTHKRISEEEKKVEDVIDNDDLMRALEENFKVGEEFSYDEILSIVEEGERRFEFKIPPGYGDLYNGEKKGTQIFADLIIWKEIIKYAKEKKTPLIFITNDNGKDDDWCYLDEETKRIISPREELIKEIYDAANVDFWMYNLPQFLFHANEQLKSTIKNEIIEGAEHVITLKTGNIVSKEQWEEISELAKNNINDCNIKIEEIFDSNSTVGDIIKLEELKQNYPDLELPIKMRSFFAESEKALKELNIFGKHYMNQVKLNNSIRFSSGSLGNIYDAGKK